MEIFLEPIYDLDVFFKNKKCESRKLTFQLVPKTAWYDNLRSALPNWEGISAIVRRTGVCAVCGTATKWLDAHEVWKYDDDAHIQKLDDIIPVCKKCHQAIHIGFAEVKGHGDEALEWYSKVNRITFEEAVEDRDSAFEVWAERSQHKWEKDEGMLDTVKRIVQAKVDSIEPKNGKFYLNVPYAEKDSAKALGARWDPTEKKWYYLKREDTETFYRWLL